MEFPVTYDNGLVLLSIKDPVWANKAQDAINVMAEFEGMGEMPFTAHPGHPDKHVADVFEAALRMVPADYERVNITVEDLQAELDKLWPDVVLGLATEKELSLAKSLRTQIKAMS